MAMKLGSKTVSGAGTAEALVATAARYSQIIIQAMAANTGPVFVGDSTVSVSGVQIRLETPVSGAVLPSISLSCTGTGNGLALKDLYLDVTNNGEGVNYLYEEY